MTEPTPEPLLEATTTLVPVLMSTLDALGYVARHLHPPDLPSLADAVAGFDERLLAARAPFAAAPCPAALDSFRAQVLTSVDAASKALQGIAGSVGDPNGAMRAYRAMRSTTHAVAALYPLAQALSPVSRFFLDPAQRNDDELVGRLAAADHGRDDVGVLHADNAREQRGGISAYVPEYYDPQQRWPLVVVLHGGSGHGADFLWTWLREARTRGCIVLAPTSVGDTWSLMQPEVDINQLRGRVARAMAHWSIDADHVLLTGMSDGGTFSLLTSVTETGPFTHFAPISGSFHPFVLEGARDLTGVPMYLVHGALDWMFPVAMARSARDALRGAGVDLTYREIEDLSHTYPRDENPRILDWFLP
jgi:phospholipase/carboxylesterase